MTLEKLSELIASLQMLEHFLKDQPELTKDLYSYSSSYNIFIWGKSKEHKQKFSMLARKLATRTKLKKEYSDQVCSVVRKFGSVEVSISIEREAVCQRIVKEVIEHPGHYVEAYKEEVVEWKCK